MQILGADGKKTVRSSEIAQNEALKGDSVARETGSVEQEYTRIRSIEDTGIGFVVYLKPSVTDLRDSVFFTYEEMAARLMRMRYVLKKVPLKDQKSVSEMLIEIERKLYEAMNKSELAQKEVEAAVEAQKKAQKAQIERDKKVINAAKPEE